MIDKILESKQLGNEGQIQYILNLLKRNSCTIEGLRTACFYKQYDFVYSFKGLLLLLEWLKIVKRENNIISLNTNIAFANDGKISQQFYQLLFKQLSEDGVLNAFLNQDNVSCYAKDELILINNDLIDFKFSPFRNFLINLHFFIPDKLVQNQFNINSDYKELFLNVVIPLIESSRHRNVTLEEMKKKQKTQELQGKEAEEFVLSFEQSRLRHHISIDNVKIISEDNVSAGYDIQSYQDIHAIIINRFIEVKSFSGNESFYWSKNEIDISKKKEDQYCLYLVDRDKMKKKGYKPIIIQNPYNNILLNEEEWDKRVEKYYFQLKANKIQTV